MEAASGRAIGSIRPASASSPRPPARVATTGNPTANASRTTLGKPSAGDGKTKTSAAARRSRYVTRSVTMTHPRDPVAGPRCIGDLAQPSAIRPVADDVEHQPTIEVDRLEQRLEPLAAHQPTRPDEADRVGIGRRPGPRRRVAHLGRLDEAGDDPVAIDHALADDQPPAAETDQPPDDVIAGADRPATDAPRALEPTGGDIARAPGHPHEARDTGPRRDRPGQRGVRGRHLDPDQIRAGDRARQRRSVGPQQPGQMAQVPGDPVERRGRARPGSAGRAAGSPAAHRPREPARTS